MGKHRTVLIAAAGAAALMLSACGSSGATQPKPKTNIAADQTMTAPATKDLQTLTWYGGYRPVYSLDPVKDADYPEETILPNVCTSLLQLGSDYSLQPSIATAWKQTSPTSVVFTIRQGVKFSDGTPLTTDDVVYSLKRNMDPAQASAFADIYSLVKSITATGADQVTVAFTKPNAIFVSAMATLGGSIVSEAYAKAKGASFGTPKGGVLCAGPYQVASYDGTHDLTVTKNPYYWDTAQAPKVTTVRFVFPTDDNALAHAIDGGSIQGGFGMPPSDIGPLSTSTVGKLYLGGPGSSPQNVDIIPTDLTKGPLADVRVRQALSLAVDRAALAKTVWAGAAEPLSTVAGPGLFGPAKADYQPTYDKLAITTDVAKAKQLVAAAGATGETIRFSYPSDGDYVTALATYLQQVGTQIGLNIKLVGLPYDQFGNLFIDAGARAKTDAFMTINYLEFPEPVAMIHSYASPDGFQDYEGYNNPQVTALLDQAGGTTDPAARAVLVNQVQTILATDLPWIPLVAPSVNVFLATGITGAPLTFSYMSSPWLVQVGGL
ncbi:MAG TPA: ABC transporter substrate-binding protein [Micromonosporaceae bacterium]|jgi:peptide/nickel transport system substrate-binding protein